MPRQKCPQCGAPIDAAVIRVECDYCGWRGKTRVQLLIGDLWRISAELVFFIAWGAIFMTGVNFRKHISEFLPLLVITLTGLVYRFLPARERKSPFVDLMPREVPETVVPVRAFPHEPVFPTPRSWKRILVASRPRRLRLSPAIINQFVVPLVMLLFAVFFVLVCLSDEHTLRTTKTYFGVAFGAAAILFFAIGVRDAARARALMKDGEVTVGWVTDVWEPGGRKTKIRNLTVEFRDAANRLLAHDFKYRHSDDNCDPGHPILVFYNPLNPEECTIECATVFKLAEPEASTVAAQLG